MTPDRQTLVPPALVAPLVLVAVVAEAGAWALAARAGTLGPGFWYGRGDLLASVHLVTVGTLALAITGTGWQLVPVVTAKAPGPGWTRTAHLVNGALVVGLLGLVCGFLWHGPWLGLGGAVLVGGLLTRMAAVLWALADTEGRVVQRGWLAAAEVSLLGGLVLAAMLVVSRSGGSAPADPMATIGHHAALMLVGWTGGWMVGLGSLLLPMFSVAPEPRPAVLTIAGAAWFLGVAGELPWLWALGALVAVAALLHSLARRVRRKVEPALVASVAGLLALAGLAIAVLVGQPAPTLVAGALLLWALPFLRGVALRILPFLAWVHLLGDLGSAAPPVGALVPRVAAAMSVAAGLVAGALVVAGSVLEQWPLARAGAIVGLLGAAATFFVLVISVVRALRLRQRSRALPGMETR